MTSIYKDGKMMEQPDDTYGFFKEAGEKPKCRTLPCITPNNFQEGNIYTEGVDYKIHTFIDRKKVVPISKVQPMSETPIDILRKSAKCLYLELPESIADDVKKNVENAISYFESNEKQLLQESGDIINRLKERIKELEGNQDELWEELRKVFEEYIYSEKIRGGERTFKIGGRVIDELKSKYTILSGHNEFPQGELSTETKPQERRFTLPKIICLCGSTKFMEAFQEANLKFTLEGKIVLSVGTNTKSDAQLTRENYFKDPSIKQRLDELHKRKIDLADEVFILNVGGYIGESTRSELEYAISKNKPIEYLEPLT